MSSDERNNVHQPQGTCPLLLGPAPSLEGPFDRAGPYGGPYGSDPAISLPAPLSPSSTSFVSLVARAAANAKSSASPTSEETKQPRCPTDEEDHHPRDIVDHRLHYISCVKIADRPGFWREDHPVWEYEFEAQLKKHRRIQKAKDRAKGKDKGKTKEKAEDNAQPSNSGATTEGNTAQAESAGGAGAGTDARDQSVPSPGSGEPKPESHHAGADAGQPSTTSTRPAPGDKVDETDPAERAARLKVRAKIFATASYVGSLYRRTGLVRDAISADATKEAEDQARAEAANPGKKKTKYKDVVACLRESSGKWRKKTKTESGENAAIEERRAVAKAIRDFSPDKDGDDKDGDDKDGGSGDGGNKASRIGYNVDKDLNAYYMRLNKNPGPEGHPHDHVFYPAEGEAQRRTEAKSLRRCGIQGRFPDQKIKVHNLLNHRHNPGEPELDCILLRKPPDKRINYVHIPLNNMEYVEKIIPQYYGEEEDDLSLDDGPFADPLEHSRSYMLLRPQYWRGNQHGSGPRSNEAPGMPVHERHIRPLCELISSDPPNPTKRNLDSIALFMPFLHWEFDRARFKVARMIDEESEKRRKAIAKAEADTKRRRIAENKRKAEEANHLAGASADATEPKPDKKSIMQRLKQNMHWPKIGTAKEEDKETPVGGGGEKADEREPYHDPLRRDTSEAIVSLDGALSLRQGPFRVEPNGRTRVGSWRGQYLLDAARLYEAIHLYRDKKMIQKYLFRKAALHPRRTLDQSYSWTLKTTRDLDRDQVVYRGTSMNMKFVHRLMREDDVCRNKKGIEKKKAEKEKAKRDEEEERKRKKEKKEEDKKEKKEKKEEEKKEKKAKTATAVKAKSKEPETLLPKYEDRGDGTTAHHEEKPAEAISDKLNKTKWVLAGAVGDHVPSEGDKTCDQCRQDIRKIARVVMVDQLWMWVLDKQTIITCFPRRYGLNKSDPSGVFKAIRMRVEGGTTQIRSVFDLALLIIRECSNTLLDRSQSQDKRPQVIDIFAEAIGRIDHKLAVQFERLWNWTEDASTFYNKPMIDATDFYYQLLLDINPEGTLMKEIRDIIDELAIIISIKEKQRELLERFVKFAKQCLEEHPDDGDSKSATKSGGSTPFSSSCCKDEKPTSAAYNGFKASADDVLAEIAIRIDELKELKLSAKSTAENVKDLLSLKQQQAGVVQARQAVEQGQETVRQSRSIMMFTVVTIFFLPLAFMASIFGMNNTTFQGDSGNSNGTTAAPSSTSNGTGSASNSSSDANSDGGGLKPMTLAEQLYIMFPISFVIIFIACWIAFSRFVRTVFWAAYKVTITVVTVKSGLYYLRLRKLEKVSSVKLTRWTQEFVGGLRDGVERDYNLKKMRERQKEAKEQQRQMTWSLKETAAAASDADENGGQASSVQPQQQGEVPPKRRRKMPDWFRKPHDQRDTDEANGKQPPMSGALGGSPRQWGGGGG